MKFYVIPEYMPITEKPYCCVPAVLQMIQERRGLKYTTQDEIGYQLGLIVPQDIAYLFTKIRTGKMPLGGWGTQVSQDEYSINNYFKRYKLPLNLTIYRVNDIENIPEFIIQMIQDDNDIIICYNSQHLFGDGDTEHVSLITDVDMEGELITIIDPAINAPKIRKTTLSKLLQVLKSHESSNLGGFWIIKKKTFYQ